MKTKTPLFTIVYSLIIFIMITTITPFCFAKSEIQRVTFASGGHISHFLPFDLALALGFFEDEGIDPIVSYVKGGTATAQALISGQVAFSLNSIDHAFKAAVKGKDDLRMIVLFNQTPGMVLVIDSKYKDSINSINKLKGMKLGVTSKGSATHMVLSFLLARNEVLLNDVDIVKAGASTFPAALKAGEIDGGIAIEPFASILVENGDAYKLQSLLTFQDCIDVFEGPYNQAGILTTHKQIDENPELVQKVVNVHMRSLKWIREHSSKEIADVLPKEIIGSNKDRYISTLDVLKEFYSPTGKINSDGVKNVLESMYISGVLDRNIQIQPEKFFTNQFVGDYSLNKQDKVKSENQNTNNSVLYYSMSILAAVLVFLGLLKIKKR